MRRTYSTIGVKRREQWRPYAASVLEHKAVDWFKLRSPSPYMLRAITVRDDQARLIPAVVHCDGTCRVQTVGGTPYVLASFRALLEEFEGLTGLPLVLNTSLNSGGEPIHGSASQSIRLLTESRIDALCIGDRVLMRNP
jgi:carbamoyltransferase